MNAFNVSKLISLGVLSFSLAALPVMQSASAQDTTTTPGGTTTTTTEPDRSPSWGWLGLLGLAGLAGLANKKRDTGSVAYRDPDPTSTTSRSDFR